MGYPGYRYIPHITAVHGKYALPAPLGCTEPIMVFHGSGIMTSRNMTSPESWIGNHDIPKHDIPTLDHGVPLEKGIYPIMHPKGQEWPFLPLWGYIPCKRLFRGTPDMGSQDLGSGTPDPEFMLC